MPYCTECLQSWSVAEVHEEAFLERFYEIPITVTRLVCGHEIVVEHRDKKIRL